MAKVCGYGGQITHLDANCSAATRAVVQDAMPTAKATLRWGTFGPWITVVVFTAAAFTGLRHPIAAFNRWVADAIDPQPPPLRMPLLVSVPSKYTRTRFAALTEIDPQVTVIEESSDAWMGTWRPAVKTLVKTNLEDAARKLVEERGFECHAPFTIPYYISDDLRSRDLGTRRINCSREEAIR